MVDKEAWIRVVLPTIDNKFVFQPASFYLTLSSTKLKSWFDGPGCFIGIPKYFLIEGVDLNPKVLHISSLLSISIFGEKYTLDFDSLINCLDFLQKVSMTSRMVIQFAWFALAKRTRSSAKKRWEKLGPFLEALTGFHNFLLTFSSMSWPKKSIHKMKI